MRVSKTRCSSFCVSTFIIVVIIFGLYIACGWINDNIPIAMPFGGPINKPAFQRMNWERMTMSYWVQNTRTDDTLRHFNVAGKALELLKEKFRVSIIRGRAIQCERGRGLLYTHNKKLWRFCLWRPKEVALTDDNNLGHSYYVDLNDLDFYNYYRDICLENERKYDPNVSICSIKACYDGEIIVPLCPCPASLPEPKKDCTRAKNWKEE